MSEGMRARRRVLVAYSGGVDSALVARIARDALGGNALAVITDTETLTRREMDAARRTAVDAHHGALLPEEKVKVVIGRELMERLKRARA